MSDYAVSPSEMFNRGLLHCTFTPTDAKCPLVGIFEGFEKNEPVEYAGWQGDVRAWEIGVPWEAPLNPGFHPVSPYFHELM